MKNQFEKNIRKNIPQKLSQTIGKINKKLISKFGKQEFIINSNWKEIVGDFFFDYSEPIRTSTIMYDLVGLLSFLFKKNQSIKSVHQVLNNPATSFEGLDGRFSFDNNLIKRKLDILQILNGKAILLK